MEDDRWFDFRYQYIETGWFDYDRTKTIDAMRKICERVPEDVVDSLPPITLFAPSPAKLGEVKPFGAGDALFVYLSPRLEKKSQVEVDFTLAHEFAHIVLGHYKPGRGLAAESLIHQDAPSEKEADELAESWGFRSSKSRISRHRTLRRRTRRSLSSAGGEGGSNV